MHDRSAVPSFTAATVMQTVPDCKGARNTRDPQTASLADFEASFWRNDCLTSGRAATFRNERPWIAVVVRPQLQDDGTCSSPLAPPKMIRGVGGHLNAVGTDRIATPPYDGGACQHATTEERVVSVRGPRALCPGDSEGLAA